MNEAGAVAEFPPTGARGPPSLPSGFEEGAKTVWTMENIWTDSLACDRGGDSGHGRDWRVVNTALTTKADEFIALGVDEPMEREAVRLEPAAMATLREPSRAERERELKSRVCPPRCLSASGLHLERFNLL